MKNKICGIVVFYREILGSVQRWVGKGGMWEGGREDKKGGGER